MTRVVSDTGPLLHLSEAQALHLLRLVGETWIPPQVAAEMADSAPAWVRPEWLGVEALTESHAAMALAWQQAGLLHAGEAEAIALARQQAADWLLTDDTAARLLATGLGLEVHGSLGIVLWAAAAGHIERSETEAFLERLANSSLWVSRRIMTEARSALDEIFGS